MPRVASVVPDESDLLCEGCGYILNGLPRTSAYPECGKPIQQSVGDHRHRSKFEQSATLSGFVQTTRMVIFAPKRFFRSLKTRVNSKSATVFARAHTGIAAVLFTAAAGGHLAWALNDMKLAAHCALIGTPVTYLLLVGLMRLTTWLSAIEARYWGMRLPYAVVKRGLQFHTANYLPVGLLTVTIVWVYPLLLMLRLMDQRDDPYYLYALCAAVVLCALYLFQTYWIAMRNMMFANR